MEAAQSKLAQAEELLAKLEKVDRERILAAQQASEDADQKVHWKTPQLQIIFLGELELRSVLHLNKSAIGMFLERLARCAGIVLA